MAKIELPEYSEYKGEKRIALLDTTVVSFLNGLDDKGFSPEVLLRDYDVILIPEWVAEEVFDSELRVAYLNKLLSVGLPIRLVEETKYSDFANYEESNLFDLVCASVSKLGSIKGYLRRNVQTSDPLDMDAYRHWIQDLDDNWPEQGVTLKSGRVKKKNAGEISITILAEIFSWYYPDLKLITVYSQDRDTYEFISSATESLLNRKFRDAAMIPIAYKSNDAILCQMYRDSELTESDVLSLRKDAKRLTYTKVLEDNSVVFSTSVVENDEYLELIKDSAVHIVF